MPVGPVALRINSMANLAEAGALAARMELALPVATAIKVDMAARVEAATAVARPVLSELALVVVLGAAILPARAAAPAALTTIPTA